MWRIRAAVIREVPITMHAAARLEKPLLAILWTLAACTSSGLALAQDPEIDCGECHEDTPYDSPAHEDVTCIDCHSNVSSEHDDADLEPLTDEESCAGCHRRPHRETGRSAHKEEATCNDCHGDPHFIHWVADIGSAVSAINQLENCGTCHDEPPSLVQSYIDSVHGKALLESGLTDAPACSDCHGSHLTLPSDNKRSMTSHAKTPETCGSCHELLLNDWQVLSAHGLAWDDGNEDAPVCTSCHESHDIVDPNTDAARLAAAEVCGGCHEADLATFRMGYHGKANRLGQATVANCADCHTPHKNLPADDPRSSVHTDNLLATCGACHEGINESFTTYDPHNNPKDPEDNYFVYLVWLFMIGLLISVFGFFGLHDLLWLQRSVVGVIRGEYDHDPSESGQYIRRFTKMNIRMHLVIIVTFLALALTGLPLSFNDRAWAQTLMGLLGGVEMAGLIHRIAAIGTFGYFAVHLGNLLYRRIVNKERGMFWGPYSMVPQPKDLVDLFANIRHFLYLGKPAEGDRWNYIEKFDYLAVFWGVGMIGLSGLMIWFPIWFTQFVPGWLINAAYIIHSEEALLATGFIFIFHFFHTHLRPQVFPMDIVIFTGKLPLEHFRKERPLEYQRLVDNGELEQYLVDPPTTGERKRAYLFGGSTRYCSSSPLSTSL